LLGEVKLLDLGLARVFAESGADGSFAAQTDEVTGTGQAMGTADYMAPEQASDSRGVDIRADIYSLGCTLFKLLSGRAPFSGPEHRTVLDKMNAHVAQPAPSIGQFVPDVPEEVARIVGRMLAKDPRERFATPAEVAEALAPFCAGADLVALLKRAKASPAVAPDWSPGISRQTQAVNRLKPELQRPLLLVSWGWKWFLGQLVLLMMAGGFGFALGIMIRIHKDGKETAIEVPEGSKARVSAEGEIDLTLPASSGWPIGVNQGKVPPEEPPVYGGKTLDQWRELALHDLDVETRVKANQALATLARSESSREAVAETVREGLKVEREPNVLEAAYGALLTCGEPGRAALIEGIHHKDTEHRRAAIKQFTDFYPYRGDWEVDFVPALIETMASDPDVGGSPLSPPGARNLAVQALESIAFWTEMRYSGVPGASNLVRIRPAGQTSATTKLVLAAFSKQLKDPDRSVRMQVARSLESMGTLADSIAPAVIAYAKAAYTSNSAGSRRGGSAYNYPSAVNEWAQALKALGAMGPAASDAVPWLEQIRDSSDPSTSNSNDLNPALRRIRGPQPAQLPAGLGGGRGMLRGGISAVTLLMMPAVRTELKLTDDQKTKIQDLSDKVQKKLREAFTAAGDRAPDYQNINNEFTEQAFKILNADQVDRVKQLQLQRDGIAALTRDDVAKKLGLTQDQIAKIKKLQESLDQNDMLAVLTDQQRAKWKEMWGKEFTFPQPALGGRGRRGGRGVGGPFSGSGRGFGGGD